MKASKHARQRQRAIQKQVVKADKQRPKKKADQAMQAAARLYPEPPFPRQRQAKPALIPIKRPAQPEEIAPAYVFLASSRRSSYINGEIRPIIGGL